MALIQSNGTGGGNWSAGASWNGGVAPIATDDFSVVAGDIITLTADAACAGGVIAATGKLDYTTFNLISSAAITNSGAIDGGVSAGTGLSVTALTHAVGSTVDLETTSKINNSGNYTNLATWANNPRGYYTQTGNGTFLNSSLHKTFNSFILNVGAILTASGTSHNYITKWNSTGNITLNGILALGVGGKFYIASDTITVITIGAAFDVTGTGNTSHLRLQLSGSATFIDNKIGIYTFAGYVFAVMGAGTTKMLGGDWRNANFQSEDNSGVATVTWNSSVSYYNFVIHNSLAGTTTIDLNNLNLTIYGSADFQLAGTTAWTKGTGTIYLVGSGTETINSRGFNIEDIIVNAVGAIRQFLGVTVPDTMTITAGTAEFQDDLISGALSVMGTCKFTPGKNYVCADISGAGTMETLNPGNIAYIYYSGDNTWAGVLDEVILIGSLPPVDGNDSVFNMSLGLGL